MIIFYTLDGHEPVPCKDPIEWAMWFETNDRRVAVTDVRGGVVSTVFLGIDHGFLSPVPILFETMAFKRRGNRWGEAIGTMRRYATWDQAQAGHDEIVSEIRNRMEMARLSAIDVIADLIVRTRHG